ncbi:hypothetical protein DKT68_23225 [Micromonospora acroterricola]|uniref:PLL-like beta propeller domain-containing protein n=1 Tax=Micromonospora acroterricola TaxID=2202421 RepID=A0A317CVG3_9ACTN|nr:hypothetical protein [Micromonospora acroterricola]PWR06182.1 hypothetical protein DKT68_23225 [Micromonospora acroterricola]
MALGVAISFSSAPGAKADAAGKGGDYVPIDSVALLDTRSGVGGTTGLRGAKSVTTFTAVGVGGVPASGVSALMVDVTAISPTANTFLSVYPDQTTRGSSAMDASIGEVITNSAMVKPGANGKVAVYNAAGNVHIKVDVVGYFTSVTGSTGSGFVPVNHTRVVDTRTGLGTTAGTLTGGVRTANIGGGGLVPSTATAVMLDVVVIGATGGGWVTVGSSASAKTAVDYVKGDTSMGMAVKLNADGSRNVTLESRGPAVHVAITVQGYWTGSPTTGAGLRPVPATTLYDSRIPSGAQPIPANGSIEVAVGGTNGLPTRGIAAAALNVHVVSPTGGGHLTVAPLDGTPITASTANFPAAHVARSSLVVTKVGTEGKVRIRNHSSGTVHLVVDLQGWFADPTAFLPTESFARSTALQGEPADGSSAGVIVYAHTDNTGQVRVVHQQNPDDFSSFQHIPVFGAEAFTGQPSLNVLGGSKQMQVTALHTTGAAWTGAQTAANTATWGTTGNLGGTMAAPPVAVTLADGTSVIFAVDVDGRLWHYRQSGTGASWKSLGDVDLAGGLTAVKIDIGVRLVATSTTGTVKTAVYSDGTLTAWTDLGGNVTGVPAAFLNQGYRTGVVARAADGSLVMKKQELGGAWPSAWATVGTFTAAGSPAAIVDPALGRIVVVARGADNEMYRVYETEQGTGTWGEWLRLYDNPGDPSAATAATDPTIAPIQNSAGPGFVVVYRNRNNATIALDRRFATAAAAVAAKKTPPTVSFNAHIVPAPPA